MGNDIERRIRALEARVLELCDIEAVRRLRHRYHECINDGEYDHIASLFAEDGEIDFGYLGHAAGRESLERYFQNVPRMLPFLKQFIHNHVVDIDGDRGTGYSYLEAKSVSQGESYIVAARYDDEYVRVHGAWKFKRMTLTPYFTVPLREGWAQEDRLKMGRQ